MGSYRVKKASLHGEIAIPPSKSHTLRAILFATMAKGKSTIFNYLSSPDTFAMIEACRHFGACVEIHPDRLDIMGIDGSIVNTEDVIHAGNSGIVLRFCSALGALSHHPVVVTGDHSIRHYRSMKALLEGLGQLGAKAISMRGDGYAPIIIQGPITKNCAHINGADSQPVSALLIAGAFADHPIDIHVIDPGEKPWVAMTLHWFDKLGIKYENHNYEFYKMFGKSSYAGFEYAVPGDISTASFPIAAALITGSELILKNIDMDDIQGDKELIEVFKAMGATIDFEATQRTLIVRKDSRLKGVTVDINNYIDALPILSAVACSAAGETHIRNAAVAKHKECDRITCIHTELSKMGANIQALEDGLIVRQSKLKGTRLHSYNDHRMAMTLTVAALGAHGESVIGPVDCVAKTFPTFHSDFNALGANIKDEL